MSRQIGSLQLGRFAWQPYILIIYLQIQLSKCSYWCIYYCASFVWRRLYLYAVSDVVCLWRIKVCFHCHRACLLAFNFIFSNVCLYSFNSRLACIGEQCSCGAWITPSFQVHKAKVDIINPSVSLRAMHISSNTTNIQTSSAKSASVATTDHAANGSDISASVVSAESVDAPVTQAAVAAPVE